MGGFVPGFGAWIEHYEDEDLTVVVLTNLNNGAMQTMVSDLAAIVLGEWYEPPPSYQDRALEEHGRVAFVGAWVCEGGPEFTIQPAGRRLAILWRHGAPAQPLWAQSDTLLFYPQDWATIVAGPVHAPRSLTYRAAGAPRGARCEPGGVNAR